MSLISASYVIMVSIDCLITTAIKEALNKNNEQIPLLQLLLLKKNRNDPIYLELIEERIESLIKTGTLIKQTIQRSCFLSGNRKRYRISRKKY